MKTEFTPGPWMALPSVIDWQYVICNTDGYRVDVAHTYGLEETPRRANANLIAAAPDMYAMLDILLDDLENSFPEQAERIEILLAKARGEQP